MNPSRRFLRAAVLGISAVTLWGMAATQADARPPRTATATVTRTGPGGQSLTRRSSVTTNGQGGYSAGSTITGPRGATAVRSQSGAYNAATQTYSRTGTTTYANGKQSSFSASTQATGNGYTRSAVHTGPNGHSATETRAIQTGAASNSGG